jgi:hypothetical protein
MSMQTARVILSGAALLFLGMVLFVGTELQFSWSFWFAVFAGCITGFLSVLLARWYQQKATNDSFQYQGGVIAGGVIVGSVIARGLTAFDRVFGFSIVVILGMSLVWVMIWMAWFLNPPFR